MKTKTNQKIKKTNNKENKNRNTYKRCFDESSGNWTTERGGG
jgi:hypothetical protein